MYIVNRKLHRPNLDVKWFLMPEDLRALYRERYSDKQLVRDFYHLENNDLTFSTQSVWVDQATYESFVNDTDFMVFFAHKKLYNKRNGIIQDPPVFEEV